MSSTVTDPGRHDSAIPELFTDSGTSHKLYQGIKLIGTLKYQPEDFIVTEISSDGELVTLDKDIEIAPPPVINVESDHSTDSDDIIDPVLTTDHLSLLEQLSNDYEATPPTTPFTSQINLGCHGDRDTRMCIHYEVKDKFPLLQTITRRSDDTGILVHEVIAMPDPAYQKLHPLLGGDETKKLLHFIKTTDPTTDSSTCTLGPYVSKEHRTKVHYKLQELYGNFLNTRTQSSEEEKPSKRVCRESAKEVELPQSEGAGLQIIVRFQKRLKHKKVKGKKTENYFTSFVLKKVNAESTQAIVDIAKGLHARPNQFTVAGTKDKRAITYQRVTAKNINMKQLSKFKCAAYDLGSFEYVSEPLSLGDLSGNHFNILIRNITTCTDSTSDINNIIKDCMASLRDNGYINYYGVQRTGLLTGKYYNSLVIPQVGWSLLQDDHEKAVKLLLHPQEGEGPTQQAKEYYTNTGDIEGTIERMPWTSTKELMILKSLRRYGFSKFGCERAIMSIPRQARVFYGHSFTSLLWNHLASYRIQQYGNQPVVGDLVIADETKSISERVEPITSHDIESNRYTINDVVIPVPGHDVILPDNSVGVKLKELLTMVGLTLLSFKSMKMQRSKMFVIPGAYRKLIAHPNELIWKTTPSLLPGNSSMTAAGGGVDLRVEFKLDSGCYATTMFDEILNLNVMYY